MGGEKKKQYQFYLAFSQESKFYPHLKTHLNTNTTGATSPASELFSLLFFLPGTFTFLIFRRVANFILQASPQISTLIGD